MATNNLYNGLKPEKNLILEIEIWQKFDFHIRIKHVVLIACFSTWGESLIYTHRTSTFFNRTPTFSLHHIVIPYCILTSPTKSSHSGSGFLYYGVCGYLLCIAACTAHTYELPETKCWIVAKYVSCMLTFRPISSVFSVLKWIMKVSTFMRTRQCLSYEGHQAGSILTDARQNGSSWLISFDLFLFILANF